MRLSLFPSGVSRFGDSAYCLITLSRESKSGRKKRHGVLFERLRWEECTTVFRKELPLNLLGFKNPTGFYAWEPRYKTVVHPFAGKERNGCPKLLTAYETRLTCPPKQSEGGEVPRMVIDSQTISGTSHCPHSGTANLRSK